MGERIRFKVTFNAASFGRKALDYRRATRRIKRRPFKGTRTTSVGVNRGGYWAWFNVERRLTKVEETWRWAIVSVYVVVDRGHPWLDLVPGDGGALAFELCCYAAGEWKEPVAVEDYGSGVRYRWVGFNGDGVAYTIVGEAEEAFCALRNLKTTVRECRRLRITRYDSTGKSPAYYSSVFGRWLSCWEVGQEDALLRVAEEATQERDDRPMTMLPEDYYAL